jgi:hypothetical protein
MSIVLSLALFSKRFDFAYYFFSSSKRHKNAPSRYCLDGNREEDRNETGRDEYSIREIVRGRDVDRLER